MKIYTKGGDRGKTSLFSGQRVPKSHPLIEALGGVDEANSAIGVAGSLLPDSLNSTRRELELIQHALFDVGALLATLRPTESAPERFHFDGERVHLLEQWIDSMEEELPPLKAFILPGGHPAAAALHLARVMARRAERLAVIPLSEREENAAALAYLNRLSDYLFVASRFVNHRLNIEETKWQPHKAASS